MSAKFTPNNAGIKNIEKSLERALNLTADIVAQRIDNEVPFKTGALSMSALQGGKRTQNAKDNSTAKYIGYTAPYALKMYYGVNYNFTKDKHSSARSFWGRELMTNQNEIERIFKIAYKKIGGR